jgi:hypothetical protein
MGKVLEGTMTEQITIDLGRDSRERWQLTATQVHQARDLLQVYKRDLGLRQDMGEFLSVAAHGLIRKEYWSEMESLAREAGVPVGDVVLCNCYYDVMKVVLGGMFGCTAFAVDHGDGVLHARNLDWWTEDAALAKSTAVCRFIGAPAGEFTTVGWPGFAGVFSAVAPGRFAISLNAVLSLEAPQPATPVVFLIRTVLEEARTYSEALRMLSESPIPSDCLLLVTGIEPGEMAVIERTPSRHAIRYGSDGCICVTNGYQALAAGMGNVTSELMGTWCQRFERVE